MGHTSACAQLVEIEIEESAAHWVGGLGVSKFGGMQPLRDRIIAQATRSKATPFVKHPKRLINNDIETGTRVKRKRKGSTFVMTSRCGV